MAYPQLPLFNAEWWGEGRTFYKKHRLNFFFYLSPVQGSLKVFSTVEWGDRRFSNLGGVIEKYYEWGVSVLNGEYFC